MNRIEDWALAIKRHEGYYPGSASYRNNNPGNFRCSSLVMGEFGATKCVNNLAVFPTYEKGWAALKQFLIYACTDKLRSYKSTMTLLEFYQRYAPSSDNNNPTNYASAVAKDLGISINAKIGSLYKEDVPVPIPVITMIENQLDKRYDGWYLGKVKTSDFHRFACHLFCWAYMAGKDPKEVDKIFTDSGVYYGDMIDSVKAAKALGLNYFGKETDINKPPNWSPSIKEVDFSIAGGKQQHFVIRINDATGKYILDPYQGVKRKINHYEEKTKAPNWENGHFSYRLAKRNN
ncbi:MAG: hypothetical protein WC412_08340 [Candidatus Omnitrophota bacterium]|jgi:hypothetical protein